MQKRRNRSTLPPLTPNFERVVPKAKDAINEALAFALMEKQREIAGRDKRLAAQEATIRELRTAIRFLQNAAKLEVSK